MQENWASSLSGFETVRIATVRDQEEGNGSHFDFKISTPDTSSFPSPPPRRQLSSTATHSQPQRRKSTVPDHHDHAEKAAFPFRHNVSSHQSLDTTKMGAVPRRDYQHRSALGEPDPSLIEAVEQLRQMRYSSWHHSTPANRKQSSPRTPEEAKDLYCAHRAVAHSRSSILEKRQKDPWQRPQALSGLPTSYSHDRLRRLTAATPTSTQSPPPLPKALQADSAPSLDRPSPTSRQGQTSCSERPSRQRSLSSLSPSPAIHFEVVADQSWPHYVSEILASSPRRTSITSSRSHSRNGSLGGLRSSNHGHSRETSQASSAQTYPTSSGSSCQPSRQPSGSGSPVASRARDNTRSTMAKNVLDGVEADPADHALHSSTAREQPRPHPTILEPSQASRDVATHDQQHSTHSPVRSQFELPHNPPRIVTTELVYGPRYLEPHNKCEAIMFPRPRLRSRSVGTTPAIVVEKVHSAPERFWQRDTGGDSEATGRLAPMSSIAVSTQQRSARSRAQSEHGHLTIPLTKDSRLVLHDTIPPPLPPKDTPLPSSGLLPSKPLPVVPTPSPPPPPPKDEEAHTSAETVELLEPAELLERNRQIDTERQAWRDEYRSSIGANSAPILDRLSPCLKDPSSPIPTANVSKKRQEGGAPTQPQDTRVPPIRVHRVSDKDGTEQTFLVVSSQPTHPYMSKKMTASSPDLRSASRSQRPQLVNQLASRLSGLAYRTSSKSRGRGVSLEAAESQDQRQAPSPGPTTTDSRASIGTGRILGKERKLVTDEVVAICRQGEQPPDGEMAVTGDRDTAQSLEVQAVSQNGEAGMGIRPRPQPSSYRAGGSRNEIIAQLGEQHSMLTKPRYSRHFDSIVGQEALTVFPMLIDPASLSVSQGDLCPSRNPAVPQGCDPAALARDSKYDTDDTAQPEDNASSVSESRSNPGCPSDSICERSSSTAKQYQASSKDKAVQTGSSSKQHSCRDGSSDSLYTARARTRASVISRTEQAARQLNRASTDDSVISSETYSTPRVWDASSVSLDNLFFRPPPARQPSS